MVIESSANVIVKNNNIFNFRPMGLVLRGVRNVIVEGNVVSGIVERDTLSTDGGH